MKPFLLCCLLLLRFSLFAQKPVINSFAPASGFAGSQVTINGSNFNSLISGNIVFFGAVKATITAASATALTVTVPTGATYQPISVTTNSLTGYSSTPFILTFPAGSTLQQNSFETKKDFTADLHPNDVAVADFDGDGRPDAATPNNYSTTGLPASISILRSSSSNGSISFAPAINLPTGVATYAIAAGDLNGDGKPDLVSSSLYDQTISVFQNTSTSGAISFAAKTDYATNSSPYSIAIGDIDGDGRPDLAVTNYMANLLSVYRNTSSGNSISFAPKVDFSTGIFPRTAAIGDIDGDGKPDVAVTNQSDNTVSIFRNISSPGNISFAARQNFATGSAPYGVAIGDLNSDNKPDIAVSNNGNNFSVLRNTSSTGNISFAAKADFGAAYSPYQISINDMNGDGKPDVIVSSANLSVSENTSTPGSAISFASAAYLFLSPAAYATGIADFDGDGKPDIAGAIFTSDKVSFLRNRNNEPNITNYSPNPARAGDTITINGNNFIGISGITFGGTNAASFVVVNSTTIKAVVGNGSSGDIVITGQYGSGNSTYNTFYFAGPPVINSFTPVTAGQGQTVTITGRNFASVTGVSFGNTPPGSYTVTSPTEIKAVIASGTTGRVKVTTSYGADSVAGFTFIQLPTVTSFSPSYGGPGMPVTITGTNFTNTTGVSFGGIPARSFTVNSATGITAIIDTGSTGIVSVTTVNGSASYPGFTFYPAPTITSFSPIGGSTGTVVTINGTNFVSNMTVSIGGVYYYNGYYSLISSTQIRLTISSTGSNGNITITSLGGTVTASGFLFDPQPFFYTISPSEAAQGQTVTITGRNFTGATAVTLGGVPVQSFTVNSNSSITAVVGAGATGNVVITNSFGSGGSANPPFAFNTAPLITSFAPAAGVAGTRVTIIGANFNPSPAANTVFFGTIKANVVSAAMNVLTVVVPQGAENDVISVMTNGLTTHSAKPFLPTFAGGSGPLTTASFARSVSFRDGSKINMLRIADIDGDGKPDVIAGRIDTLSIYRNTTSAGTLSFAPRVDIKIPYTVQAFGIGDINSDGKPDIAVATSDYYNNLLLKNNSTPGNITLSFLATFTTDFTYPSAVFIADLDGDAKPDLAINYTGYSAITIYRNTSSGGNFSQVLAARQPYGNSSSAAYAYFTALADVDDNGKRDFVVSNAVGIYFPIVFNTSFLSISGNAALRLQTQRYEQYNTGYDFKSVCTADFDRDGKQDILFNGYILRSTGNMNFTYTQLITDNNMTKMVTSDLDGDGKPDYANFVYGQPRISAFRNITASTAISFDAATIYPVEKGVQDMTISDLDGDGKPEIIYCGNADTAFYVLKNLAGAAQTCLGGNTVFTAGITGIGYQWQVNTGSGFTNINDNGNYSGTNTPNLQLSGIPAAWMGYQYRCIVGGSNSATFTISFLNSWTGSLNNQWENPANWSCGIVPDGSTDVVINSGAVTINSNVQVRSVKVLPQASVTVATGYTLTVTH